MDYSQWWVNKLTGNEEYNLSILDLVNYGTVDCKLAALLWHLMEHRASVIVAAGPSFAGKSSLLHALLDFLPAGLHKVKLQGYYEEYKFLHSSQPQKTYLIAEEISNHGFFGYVWGHHAVKAIKLLSQGYALGGTMHARNSEEVVYILHHFLGLPIDLLGKLGIIVTLRVTGRWNYDEDPVRRINSVDLVLPHEEGLAVQVLAAQQHSEKGFDYQDEKTLQQVLARKFLTGKSPVGEAIENKRLLLERLLKEGQTSRQEVRQAVMEYYRSRTF